MRPDYIYIVRTTWALAMPNAAGLGTSFYRRLFALDPVLRILFPADLGAQTAKLTGILGVAVASLDRLETITPALELLGRRHVGYGVEDRHYDTVGQALLDALAAEFGPMFTPLVRQAWAETYATLAGVMRRAGAEAIAERRDAEQRAAAFLLHSACSPLEAAAA